MVSGEANEYDLNYYDFDDNSSVVHVPGADPASYQGVVNILSVQARSDV